MRLKSTLLFGVTASVLMTSCLGGSLPSDNSADFAADMKSFIEYNGWEQEFNAETLGEEIDLYVDYSTCVSEAKNSAYYRTVHPVIVDANPNYYSIKGSQIKFETNNRQAVYQLLNTVREVNYADIKGAVQKIVDGNNHAVLITDGEYYQRKAGVRDSQTNPYLADEFRKWLGRGYDIYIYSEPYLESGRYSKFRYYFFFTDDNVKNNIRERFQRSVPEQSDVKIFHMSGKRPSVAFADGYPVIDEVLSPNKELKCSGNSYDVQEYYTGWGDIYNYLLDNAYDERGRQLEDGKALVRGLFVNNNLTNGYKVKGLKIRVSNVGADFASWLEAKTMAEEMEDDSVTLPKAGSLRDYDLFTYDKELFEETGEIAIMLDKDNTYEGLESDYNLLKVDILMDGVVENFSQNNEANGCFQWLSITNNNQLNTSLYESIRLVLLDPTMNPVKREEEKLLYTIYMSTYNI